MTELSFRRIVKNKFHLESRGDHEAPSGISTFTLGKDRAWDLLLINLNLIPGYNGILLIFYYISRNLQSVNSFITTLWASKLFNLDSVGREGGFPISNKKI